MAVQHESGGVGGWRRKQVSALWRHIGQGIVDAYFYQGELYVNSASIVPRIVSSPAKKNRLDIDRHAAATGLLDSKLLRILFKFKIVRQGKQRRREYAYFK